MSISELYNIFKQYPKISTDSRKIEKGDIFWALKGDNFNGNDYAEKAIKLGASYAVVDKKQKIENNKFIYVKDTLQSLQNLAQYHRKKLNIPILAITGTNGKTTTKELITTVLNKKYRTGATSGNLNNHIGVPLTLLSMDSNTEIGVVEMGANHTGEIKELCDIAEPNYGIITNIGKAHLEGFGSFEGLKNTKAELYNWIDKTGIIFINNDNEILAQLINKQKTISYGTNKGVFCRASILTSNPYVSVEIDLNKRISIHSKLIGSYNFENIIAAACIGKYFNIKAELIKDAIENYLPDNNRSQIIEKGSSRIILDAYNANPTSLTLAIENFKNIEAKNRILILGDMFELGKYSEKEHFNICKILIQFHKSEPRTKIYLAGEEFHKSVLKNKLQNILKSFKTTEELIINISKFALTNTWVLIKASRGMKLESVVERLNIS